MVRVSLPEADKFIPHDEVESIFSLEQGSGSALSNMRGTLQEVGRYGCNRTTETTNTTCR